MSLYDELVATGVALLAIIAIPLFLFAVLTPPLYLLDWSLFGYDPGIKLVVLALFLAVIANAG